MGAWTRRVLLSWLVLIALALVSPGLGLAQDSFSPLERRCGQCGRTFILSGQSVSGLCPECTELAKTARGRCTVCNRFIRQGETMWGDPRGRQVLCDECKQGREAKAAADRDAKVQELMKGRVCGSCGKTIGLGEGIVWVQWGTGTVPYHEGCPKNAPPGWAPPQPAATDSSAWETATWNRRYHGPIACLRCGKTLGPGNGIVHWDSDDGDYKGWCNACAAVLGRRVDFLHALAWIGGILLLVGAPTAFYFREGPRTALVAALRRPSAPHAWRDRVLPALAEKLAGQATPKVFEGRSRDRAVRLELVATSPRETYYAIELDSTLGMPISGTLEDMAAVERLARMARAGVPEQPSLGVLAETLLSGKDDWRALYTVFGLRKIRFEEGRIRARAPFAEGLGVSEEVARLERLLERFVQVTTLVASILEVKARASSPSRCPYCHDSFADGAAIAPCPRCGARHHEECFAEHGRCAVFACGAAAV